MKSDRLTHVIGGGMAALSAALTLAELNHRVVVYEAGPALGGRCRSYHDRALDVRLDNGNHLLLSGNDEVFSFLRRIGAEHTLAGPSDAMFPFVDLANAERWTVRLGHGRIPWWLLDGKRRVPGVAITQYAALIRLLRAGPETTVAECIGQSVLARRLLEPLAIAILNTMPAIGSARLLADTFRASLLRGGAACRPAFPREGLSESLVDPALARLAALGVEIRTSCRIARIERGPHGATELAGPAGAIPVGPRDHVVIAVPAPVATALLPGTDAPDRFESIVNLHFRTDLETALPLVREAGFVGVVGGVVEWVFQKPGILSVTISAANRFEACDPDTLAARVWDEVRAALGLDDVAPMPPHRLVREKRATFEATCAQERRRPSARTDTPRLWLAGDWTATGLPATIEGAIRSGRTAADLIVRAA